MSTGSSDTPASLSGQSIVSNQVPTVRIVAPDGTEDDLPAYTVADIQKQVEVEEDYELRYIRDSNKQVLGPTDPVIPNEKIIVQPVLRGA
jgi:hypothetical protein